MGFLVVIIPIACCVLIPAAIAGAVLLGFRKKDKPISDASENAPTLVEPGYSASPRQRRK